MGALISTVTSAGQVIEGRSSSTIVIVNEQSDLFPNSSVLVLVTTVSPTANSLPEAEEFVIVGSAVQLSIAVVTNNTFAPHAPMSFLEVILSGQRMTRCFFILNPNSE